MITEHNKYTHWAKTDLTDRLHIKDATSGGNGYYCPGCSAKLIAHKGKIKKHHYQHHPKEIEKHKKCTFSNEEFRNKVAKEILQLIKEIKVPPVYIPIPEEFGGGKRLIRKSEVIKADSVKIERYFYEDEAGTINIDIEFDRHNPNYKLLLKPHVAFFNSLDEPILFIFFKSKNKFSEKDYLHLMTLGINAIEVKIPDDYNPEQIQTIFTNHKYSKWLFNYEQHYTKYIPGTDTVSANSDEDFEHEGDLPEFGETYNCAKFRIKEAIRRIRKLMGSAEFIGAQSAVVGKRIDIEREIDEIEHTLGREGETARVAAEVRVGTQLKDQILGEEKTIGELRTKEEKLERRYNRKKDQIINLHISIAGRIKRIKRELENEESEFNRKIAEIEGEFARIGEEERKLEDKISGVRKDYQYTIELRERTVGEIEHKLELNERVRKITGEIEGRRRKIEQYREQLLSIMERSLGK